MNDICNLDGFIQIKRIDVWENTAYVLGISAERTGVTAEYTDEYGIYNYGGEKMVSVDISTGEIAESSVDFPIAFSLYGGNCTVYGADKDGYYFSDFENNNKSYHLGYIIIHIYSILQKNCSRLIEQCSAYQATYQAPQTEGLFDNPL